MRKTINRIVALATGVSVVAGIATPALVSAWGDTSGTSGRRSYTLDQINHGVLGDKIVLNSISDSVDGDEKNFVSAQAATANRQGEWQGNNITVENGKEYVIRLYVHNNNPNGYDAVAEDVKVAFSIPSTPSTLVQVNGYISSSNAAIKEYWDYVNFNSTNAFHLEYVYGSALLYNNKIGVGGLKLSDNIVEQASKGGVLIGYDALDGKVPGCYTYDNYVTVRVKAVFDTDYRINEQVRLVGTKEWGNYVNAKVGDKVEFQIEYQNTSKVEEIQENVMIKEILPANLKYVPGTTKLWNGNNNGAVLNPDGALFTTGVNIGKYANKANAFLRFTAEVVNESLAGGSNTMVSWSQGGVGKITIQDYASVIVQRDISEQKAAEYNVTVKYVYADGTEAAPTYKGTFLDEDPFRVESPAIKGYTPDREVITGKINKASQSFTVTYTADKAPEPVVPDPEPTPEPEPTVPDPGDVTPEPTISEPKPTTKPTDKLPTTGPAETATAFIGVGSMITAGGYYIASKKRLQ